MPTAAPRLCNCGRQVTGKCLSCLQTSRKQTDAWRGGAADRGYDAVWQRFRLWFIRRHPLCEDCLAAGRMTATRDVHHVRKLSEHPELRLSEGNCRGLCGTCHSIRTRRGE